MKKITKIVRSNIKPIICFAAGMAVAGGTAYAATILMNANQVGFDNTGTSLSSTDVQGALDELYARTSAIEKIPTMQKFLKSSLASTGNSAVLRDTRDGNVYTVKKLADGNVWMTDNLRLVGKTISSADSDLVGNETYTVPASALNQFSQFSLNDAAYLDDTYGGYYTFLTATAGWGTTDVTSGETPKSICPKGWRLPTSSEQWRIRVLSSNSPESLQGQGDPGFVLSGRVSGPRVSNQGASAYYWGSESTSETYANYMSVDSSLNVSAGTSSKDSGYSIRCVAIDPSDTMQGFNASSLANTGDSKTLIDTRDNNKYTVKKLADGNVWMTDNLRLIDITLSSIDSNLPEGMTFTVPVTPVSNFNGTNNASLAYYDADYGSYYNFFAATAGWGTYDTTNGDSPRDICPKGWRLPTYNEYRSLYYNYYNSSALLQGDPGISLSGRVNLQNIDEQGNTGYFWSSTATGNKNYSSAMAVGNTGVWLTDVNSKYSGYSIRCILK